MVQDSQWQETAKACLPLLYKVAHEVLHNPADAQDAVQQALMHTWEKRSRIQPESLRAYLTRATLNESRTMLRRQRYAIPVETVQFWFQLGLITVYATLLCGRRLLRLRHDRFEWRWTIPATGILLAAADWLYFTGLAIPEVPISVGSLMRRFSVVITFVLGALFFRERNLRRKGIALAAILTGVVLLCF